jgi:hypothetical protein
MCRHADYPVRCMTCSLKVVLSAKITRVASGAGKVSWPGVLIIGASVVLAVVTVLVGVHKPTNALATALLQAFTFILTTLGAYTFAKASANTAARELVRPHARSAFRRQRGLYMGLGRLIDEIDSQSAEQDDENVKLGLKILRAMIIEQVGMSGDALDDWRDLVPDEVAQLEASSAPAEQEAAQ